MNLSSRVTRPPLAGAFALFTLLASDTAQAGNGRFKDGAFDFCVSVRFNATPAELQQIRVAFQNGSQILSDATDGQHRFGKVTLINNSGASQSADYWVHAGEGRAYATQGLYGVRGQHVNMFFDSDFQAVNGSEGDAYTVAHEHAHHAYGLLDEYVGPTGIAECAPAGGPEPTLSFCLMDNYFIRGGNQAGTTYTLDEFCIAANHDPDMDTHQENVEGESCWDTISTHPTRSALAPTGTPVSPPPGPHFVTFENGQGGLRVILLIDRSGSMMQAQRLQFAKSSASLYIDFLEDGDSIGVISFSDFATIEFPLTTVTGQATKDAAKAAVNGITAGGLTNIGGALQMGLGQITFQTTRSCNELMVLLSDGEHLIGPPRPQVLPQVKDAGVTVLSTGLGTTLSPAGESALQFISMETGGKYFRVQNSFELVGLYTKLSLETSGNGLLTEKPLNISTGNFQAVDNQLAPLATIANFVIAKSNPLDVITYTLREPGGTQITQASAATDPNVEYLETPNSIAYVVQAPIAGTWQQEVLGVQIQTGLFEALTYVGNNGIQLNVNADDPSPTFPEVTNLRAELLFEGQRVLMATVTGTVTRPDGSTAPITLLDDGMGNDGIADDGIYSGVFSSYNEDGTYTFDLQGDSTAGISTTFGGETHFPASPPPRSPPRRSLVWAAPRSSCPGPPRPTARPRSTPAGRSHRSARPASPAPRPARASSSARSTHRGRARWPPA